MYTHSRIKLPLILGGYLIGLLLNSPLWAEEHEQHAAHEHGVARLSLAVNKEGVELSLDSPAMNLVGFEHQPSSDADKQTIATVQQTLSAGDKLFQFNADANCKLNKTTLESGLWPSTEQSNAEHKAKPEQKQAEHETHEANEAENHHDHADIEATWLFTCEQTTQVSALTTQLFKAFPQGLEKLNVEWITDTYASTATLTQDKTLSLLP